jgi:DNA-binding transcriptional ArsR family regulator
MRGLPHPQTSDIKLERVLYALSDPLRLAIVRQLNSGGVASCGELDGGRPKSSMSHHFRVLRDAGLIRTRTDGTAHLNELRRPELEALFPGLLAAIL